MIEQPFEMNLKMVAEAGIEPARCRLMRPAPSHLAPPQLSIESGTPSECCPQEGRIWNPACMLMPGVTEKMERSAGVAPASSDWRTDILLLNDDRK